MTRSVRARVIVSCALALGLLAPDGEAPAVAAEAANEVAATDDAAGAGTCPSSNSFGFPTGGNCFTPDVITVRAGEEVTWRSIGKRPHDVVADDDAFRSPYLYPGESWSWTFDRVGEVPYYCTLHGDRGGVGHAGKVIVVAANAPKPSPAPTDSSPKRPRARTGGSQPSQADPREAPTTIATRMKLTVTAMTAPPQPGDGEPTGGTPWPFVAGALLGGAVLAGWRFATGGPDDDAA